MLSTIRVGVRELRQNLSVYLRRVEAGEGFEVTDRGRPVAWLVPRSTGDPYWDRLIAAGRVTEPERPGGLRSALGPARRDGERPLSETLQEQRERERR